MITFKWSVSQVLRPFNNFRKNWTSTAGTFLPNHPERFTCAEKWFICIQTAVSPRVFVEDTNFLLFREVNDFCVSWAEIWEQKFVHERPSKSSQARLERVRAPGRGLMTEKYLSSWSSLLKSITADRNQLNFLKFSFTLSKLILIDWPLSFSNIPEFLLLRKNILNPT